MTSAMRILVAWMLVLVGCGATTAPKSSSASAVIEYLAGAEQQVETDDQRAELRRALVDLARLSPAELRTRRYADYAMTPGRWTAATVLTRYIVPAKPVHLDEEALYRDAQRPEARAALREHVRAIDEHRQPR